MEKLNSQSSSVEVAPANVVAIPCVDQLLFDPTPLLHLFADTDPHKAEDVICRMLEDIARQLDVLQEEKARHAFARLRRPARRIELVAGQIGLVEVATAAAHVINCARQCDGLALDATVARLERGFDVAVSEVWSFRDMV